MALTVQVQLIDDLDGSAAAKTVCFGLDGSMFQINLNERNAARLRAVLTEFVAAGWLIRPVQEKQPWPVRRAR